MSIKKLLIVAGTLVLTACSAPSAPCALVEGPEEHASDERVCAEFPIVGQPQVEPAGDVEP